MASTTENESQLAGRDISYVAGAMFKSEGDMIITYEQLQKETEFFEPNLEPFKSPNFIAPTITPLLIENICQNRLMVLGGSGDIDKSAFARHLACSLSERQQASDSKGRNLPVLEWNRSQSDLQNIEKELRETTNAAIFILPKISPQDVRYDLSSIKKIADINKHLVLISTDIPFSSWKLPDIDRVFWQDLSDDLYSSDDLANFLSRGLKEVKDSLPIASLSDSLEPNQPLIDGLLIREAAINLKNPENISIFIKLLCSEREDLRLSTVRDLIRDATDKRRTIERWYPTLKSREQLLALGLSFFDGLFDDQFFAAIDRVVERVWQKRDPSLRALDYCDLDELRYFFDFVPAEEGYGVKIESRIPEQRRMLFEVAWNSHRRQILTALPIISQIASDSVAKRSYDIELYGSSIRRDQLRMVISETLSDIGLISINAVQRSLLQLASDDELGVQVVAARAMARWRQYKHDNALFNMLKDWQENFGHLGNSRNNIRATVAITVSYASRYDSPNELNNELCELLNALSKDPSPAVRRIFCNHTLPYVIPRHLIKLRKTLEDMTQETDLIPYIAKSLASACRYNDEDVIETLNIWDKRCKALQSSRGSSTIITQRERLLATIALTYGYIKYDEVEGKLTADNAFKWMQDVLNEEKNAFVHKNVVFAISHQASSNFEKIEPLLRDLLIKMTQSDIEEIVQLLTDIYLEQRQGMDHGDGSIDIDGARYPIWIDLKRPLTEVEKAMYSWTKSQDHPASQQIAVQALVSFSNALDITEKQKILEILEERKQLMQTEPEKSVIDSQVPAVKSITTIEKFAALYATWGKKPYYAIIQGLLPEILSQNRQNKPLMDFVLGKWQMAEDNDLNKIVKIQERAIWLIERPALMIGAPLLVIILVIAAVQNSMIFLILLCIMIISAVALYKSRSSKHQMQERIKNISDGQSVLWLMDNLKRYYDKK